MTGEDVLADLVGRIDDLPLPCPWCGRSDTELLCTPGSLSWVVGCKCGATGPRARVANDAVKKWNEPPDARSRAGDSSP